jgi:hypothetical protein
MVVGLRAIEFFNLRLGSVLLAATTCPPDRLLFDLGGLLLHFIQQVRMPTLFLPLGANPHSVHAIRPSYCDNIYPP